MTEVTIRLDPDTNDPVLNLCLVMIGGGTLLALSRPAVQQKLHQFAQNPDVRKLAAHVGRDLLDRARRAIGTAVLPASAN